MVNGIANQVTQELIRVNPAYARIKWSILNDNVKQRLLGFFMEDLPTLYGEYKSEQRQMRHLEPEHIIGEGVSV